MNKVHEFLGMLHRGVPFALARFNDGEMMAIDHAGCVVARGSQPVSPELSSMLRAALRHEQDGYWKGLPCSVCWPQWRRLADSMVRRDYPYLTHAVVCANRNWRIFTDGFAKAVLERQLGVVWVSGDDQHLGNLIFPVKGRIDLPPQDAFSAYCSVVDRHSDLQPGDVVVLSCGPLSRVLARQWWQERQDCTFIDVGSAFDPLTRGIRHRCHVWNDDRNALPPCRECN